MGDLHLVEAGLPQSMDAERSILGAVLLDNAAMEQAAGLEVAHFSLDSHRRIFSAMNEMYEDRVPIDIITLAEYLKSKQQLDAVGGVAYLSSLTDGIPPRANIKHYVLIVIKKAQLRALIISSNRVISRAVTNMEDPNAILRDMEQDIARIELDGPAKDVPIFVPAHKFVSTAPDRVEWRVEKIIEKGTNGLIVAPPKTGKSFVTTFLSLCLATGYPFFGLDVAQCRVALVSREDFAHTTARRMARLLKGMGFDPNHNLEPYLHISSREQCRTMMLDNGPDRQNLIRNLNDLGTEFLILDVLNKLHSSNEKDPTEMTRVMNYMDQIHDEVGCQICVIHHARKGSDDDRTISDAGRGTTAIGGFFEFGMRLELVDKDAGVRKMSFETKAGEPYESFYWQPVDDHQANSVVLERMRPESVTEKKAKAKGAGK